MKRTVRVVAFVLPLAIVVGACSSDEPTNAPPYSSGVDGSTNLNVLTPTQEQTICTSQAAFVKARIDTTALSRFWCAFTPAVLTAPDTASCNTAIDACIEKFSVQLDVTVSDPNAPPPQCKTVTTSATCTGTVKDYENCVNSFASVQLDIGTNFQCGSRADLPASPTVGVDACKALGPTCTAATAAPPQIQ
jgi:hypothetical protein